MRRVFLPTSSALLLAAYFLAPAGWFRPPNPAVAARPESRAAIDEADDAYETEAAWRYRHGQVKHWRMLVINH